jgi:outer membrane biogenesis lipoprotein LolB
MENIIKVFLLLISCLMFVACSDEGSSAEEKKDHVWKSQTDSIDKAKEAQNMLKESTEKTLNALEQQE